MENTSNPVSLRVARHHTHVRPLHNVAFRLVNLKTFQEEHHQFSDHRHRYFELIFIDTGWGTYTIDFVEYQINPNTLFLTSPGQVHNLQNAHIKDGFALIFDREYITQHQNDTGLLMRIIACGLRSPQVSISENEIIHLRHCRNLIHDELEKAHPDYELIRSALKIMLIKALQFEPRQFDKCASEAGIHKKCYFDFLLLIESHHTQRHDVSFYADKLAISSKQLTVITRLLSGRTALQTIHDRVLAEAKRLLCYSERSVKEISAALGFDDSSYFSRFFFQKTGMKPKEFQRRHPKSTA
jgi:AraC-like DNA-binding protein/mannose-6-phosphate isomerase-like protein (cupin superfamily)